MYGHAVYQRLVALIDSDIPEVYHVVTLCCARSNVKKWLAERHVPPGGVFILAAEIK